MSSPTKRTYRRRWPRRVGISLLLVCGVLGVVVWLLGWWAPPVYSPPAELSLRGTPLEPAAHDARVTRLRDSEYILHVEPQGPPAGRGALLFFGSRHSKDPNHPQLQSLSKAWADFKPTVALVEGRMSFFVGTATQGIRLFGEGAVVYTLAHRAGIPLYTLEPALEVELAALREIGDEKQVAMFRVLNGYISARRGGPVSEFKIGRLLSRRAAPLTDAFPNAEVFDREFAIAFPKLGPWRDLPEEAMWPGRTDTWLNLMATRANRARDDHFTRTMIDLVNKGERVLAIAGRSHTINFEPVLWESMQPATRGNLSTPRPWIDEQRDGARAQDQSIEAGR